MRLKGLGSFFSNPMNYCGSIMKPLSKTFKIRGHTCRVKTKAAKTVNYLDRHKDYTTQNPLGVDDIAQSFFGEERSLSWRV